MRKAMLVLLLLFLTGCGARWMEYRSGPGGYSVDLPSKVKETSQDVSTPVGTLKFHMAMAEGLSYGYAAAYVDYPESAMKKAGTPREMLVNARKGAIANVHGKFVQEREIELEGNPGLEVEFTVSQPKKIKARVRLYLVKNRLYQVMAMNLESSYDEASVNRFLDSFRLRPRLD